MTWEFYRFSFIVLALNSCLIITNQAQVLDYNTSIKVDKGKRVTYRSYLIQIDNKESNWLSNVSIHYSSNQKLEILEAIIINSAGKTVRKVSNKEIVTRSDISKGSFYEDDYVKEFRLSWNEYPYQIKYSYKITDDNFLFVANWNPAVYSSIRTIKASLQVDLPSDAEVYMTHDKRFEYTADLIDGRKNFRWEIENYSVPKEENYSPPTIELIPWVSIVPKEFKFGIKGRLESWQSFGVWLTELNEKLDQLPQREFYKINNLTKGVTDKRELIKILYHYLQDNTRYINVSLDIGGLKPYPASYVSSNKYGDCKALAIYMKALLNYVGIPSYYTIIHAGENPVRINRNLPSQQFNHVILAVPLEKDTVWLENTSNYFPYNYLGTFTQNRYALLINGLNSTLIRTPQLYKNDVYEISNYKILLDEDGTGSTTIKKSFRGSLFEDYVHLKQRLTNNELGKRVLDEIGFSGGELMNFDINRESRETPQVDISIRIALSKQFRKVGETKALSIAAFNIPKFEEPSLRVNPVRINYPIYRSDSIIYELPFISNYSLKIPIDINIDSKYGEYIENYTVKGSSIVVSRIFYLQNGDYGKNDYEQFYSFIDSIAKAQKKSVILINNL